MSPPAASALVTAPGLSARFFARRAPRWWRAVVAQCAIDHFPCPGPQHAFLSDPWLHPWLPAISARSTTSPVLEIGCGHGDDTAVLADAGLRVIAFDLSRAAVAAARLRVPSAQIECRDIRAPFPPQASELGAVIASLSLHYFPGTRPCRSSSASGTP